LGFWSGCAAIRPVPAVKAAVFASSKEALYVALPVVPGSVDSLLARMGWSGGRFAQELRKEIIFQLNRKGLAILQEPATLSDSAALRSTAAGSAGTASALSDTASSLTVNLKEYVEGSGAPSHFQGDALLKTSAGERRFDFSKSPKRAEAPERSDPTVDNIRLIAESVVSEACKVPVTKKRSEPEITPPLMMIF